MKKLFNKIKISAIKEKYLKVWVNILDWSLNRLNQNEELTTTEVKHLAEIQEKVQKSLELISSSGNKEQESTFNGLLNVLEASRTKLFGQDV